MTKLRNILKKRAVLLSLALLFLLALMFIIYMLQRTEKEDTEKMPEAVIENPEEKKEPEEIVGNTEITKDWNVYINGKLGISFKYPEDWVVQEGNTNCSLNPNYVSNCINLYDSQEQNFLQIKFEEYNNDPGSISLTKREYLNSKYFDKEFSSLKMIRLNSVNNSYTYFNKYNLSILFLKNYAIKKGFDDLSEWTVWYVNNNIGYTFTYLIDPALIPDRNNIGENEVVDAMDQIMSTLEIDFNVKPF